ncbi:MAG: sigma factor-like helix-turn-helix DNA-binding protein [Patescibacteria group bacterium]
MDSKINIAIVAKFKHGDIYVALQKRGWSVARASRELGIRRGILDDLINMRRIPNLSLETELKLAELTGKTLEEMFPKEFRVKEFLDGRRELVAFRDCDPRSLASAGIRTLPVPLGAKAQDLLDLAEKYLGELTETERAVFEGVVMERRTPRDVGEELGFSAQKVQNIEFRARRKIQDMRQGKYPSRSNQP